MMTRLTRRDHGGMLADLSHAPPRPGLFTPWWGPELARWLLAWPEPDGFASACDVLTRGEELVLRMEVPGIDPERDIEVAVADGMFLLRGKRHVTRREEDEQSRWVESWAGTFEWGVRLPASADASKIAASYEGGVLEVVVPGAVAPGARKLPVTGAGRPGKAAAPRAAA